ncbi:MAG: hypothetical protein J6Y23_09225 [Prevotella sp.]|nr:hypothetical protein [Prevotella sp.]
MREVTSPSIVSAKIPFFITFFLLNHFFYYICNVLDYRICFTKKDKSMRVKTLLMIAVAGLLNFTAANAQYDGSVSSPTVQGELTPEQQKAREAQLEEAKREKEKADKLLKEQEKQKKEAEKKAKEAKKQQKKAEKERKAREKELKKQKKLQKQAEKAEKDRIKAEKKQAKALKELKKMQ